MSRPLHGWIVSDGETFRLRSHPGRYSGSVLAEQRVGAQAAAAFDRLEPGETRADDPAVRPGSLEDGRWVLKPGGRVVWPLASTGRPV